VAAHERGRPHRSLDVVDGQHEQPRVLCPGRLQKLEARGIAVVDLVAEAAHEIDLLVARLQRREMHAAHRQHPRHDLAEAAVAGDDHGIPGLVYRVEFRGTGALQPALQQAFMEHEHARREQHRHRDHHHRELHGLAREYSKPQRSGKENEREFAPLGERYGHPLRGFVARAADAADRVHQRPLHRHQAERETTIVERASAAGQVGASCPRP
jgi:hypothetical protein